LEGSNRTRIVALAVLLAISVPLILIAVAGGGSDDGESEGLRVERSAGVPEVVIYLQDPAVNDPKTNRGRTRVGVECMDSGGTVIFRGAERWPFSDTDGGKFDPHVHVLIRPALLDRVARCRLRGTDPPLEGRKV
jgi:hypothetical protein